MNFGAIAFWVAVCDASFGAALLFANAAGLPAKSKIPNNEIIQKFFIVG